MPMRVLTLDGPDTIVVAILAYFLGQFLTARVEPLETYRIPEAVTGGLLVALLVALIRAFGGIELVFTTGPLALLFFFASIGLNASLRDLAAGGRPLVVLLAITAGALLMENVIGTVCAWFLGAPPLLGLMAGSVSLLGGHGTAAAWGAIFAQHTHMAPVIGLASATFGLVAGGIIGGPVGRFLIERYRLHGGEGRGPIRETAGGGPLEAPIDVASIFAAILVLALAIGLGDQIGSAIAWLGLKLPAFVTAIFAGIVIGNLGPRLLPRLNWPIGSPALSLLSELALNLFLTRALMSLELWTLAAVAGPLLLVLTFQVLAMILIARYLVFPLLGRDYDAAVIGAGFIGISLGATPTAVANMSALTHRYGASAKAFLVVPLVGAFFIDLLNAVVISTGYALLAP
jgi:ESS family glutamate:Na+ symporter